MGAYRSFVAADAAGNALAAAVAPLLTQANNAMAPLTAVGLGSALLPPPLSGASTSYPGSLAAATFRVANVTNAVNLTLGRVGASLSFTASTNQTGRVSFTFDLIATDRGGSAQTTVSGTIDDPPVSSLTVTPLNSTLAVGRSLQLAVVARDAQGKVVPSPSVVWSSANPAIVFVTSTGLVTGVGVGGPVAITASAGGVSAAANVTVHGACVLNGLKSISGTTPTSITIDNRTSEALTLKWVDYTGGLVTYPTVAAGSVFTQLTYLTHPWLLQGASGSCYGPFMPVAGGSTIIIY